MVFWESLEKEFNDNFGNAQNGETEAKAFDHEFDGLIGEIKDDLKKIKKDEVIPSFSRHVKDKEMYEQEKQKYEAEKKTRKKYEKHCGSGDKTYEIGQRWQDPKTGKEMICILMNIPKDVRPILKKANIPLSATPPKEKKKVKKPSKGKDWSYTNKQESKPPCEETNNPGEEEEVDIVAELSSGEQPEAIAEDLEEEDDEEKSLAVGVEELEEDAQEDEKQPSDGPVEENQEEGDDKPKEPEIIVVDPEENEDDEESASEADPKANSIDYESVNIPKRTPEEPEDDYEQEEEPEKREKLQESEEEDAEVITNTLYKTGQNSKDNDEVKDEVNKNEDSEQNGERLSQEVTKEPCETENQEQGEPIYTRETVVVQRKLFKTEETIEVTETETEKTPEK